MIDRRVWCNYVAGARGRKSDEKVSANSIASAHNSHTDINHTQRRLSLKASQSLRLRLHYLCQCAVSLTTKVSIMTHCSRIIIPFAALLLVAPLSASIAQTAEQTPTAAPTAATSAAILPGPQGKSSHPRCRHHGAGGKTGGHGGGKAGHHGKRKLVLEQLERIEQRQILIETMLRQLLARSGS